MIALIAELCMCTCASQMLPSRQKLAVRLEVASKTSSGLSLIFWLLYIYASFARLGRQADMTLKYMFWNTTHINF